MYEYTPTATDMALSIYTNAIIDLRNAVNLGERARLLRRATFAWNAFVRADNPFPGWKLPTYRKPESCARLCTDATYAERGCLYPCACKIVNE